MTTTTKNAPAPVSTEPTMEQLKAELAQAKADKQALIESAASGGNRKFGMKIGDKGGCVISVPGQRMPINGYPSDVIALYEHAADVLGFISEAAKGTRLRFGTDKDVQEVADAKKANALARIAALRTRLGL